MSELYDADFVLWSEQQAELLRRLSRGEQVNDVDWLNLVEEVDGLGRSEINAVSSLLQRALEHLLKQAAWPDAPAVRKWVSEARSFLDDAQYHWTPSMATRVDLANIYRRAVRAVQDLDYDEGPPGPLPPTCPVTLQDLMAGDVRALADRFRPA